MICDLNKLIGLTITTARPMTKREMRRMGWGEQRDSTPLVLELSNGRCLVFSSDEEGNNQGALFVTDENLALLGVDGYWFEEVQAQQPTAVPL